MRHWVYNCMVVFIEDHLTGFWISGNLIGLVYSLSKSYIYPVCANYETNSFITENFPQNGWKCKLVENRTQSYSKSTKYASSLFCPYIHTYIHTYILTYIHTYIHTYIRVDLLYCIEYFLLRAVFSIKECFGDTMYNIKTRTEQMQHFYWAWKHHVYVQRWNLCLLHVYAIIENQGEWRSFMNV